MGTGVAGTGISGAGQIIGLGADITDRAAVRHALEDVVLAYGGLDHVVVTAGYYPSPDEQGNVADEEWGKTFATNVMGPFLVAHEAWRVWQAPGAGARRRPGNPPRGHPGGAQPGAFPSHPSQTAADPPP